MIRNSLREERDQLRAVLRRIVTSPARPVGALSSATWLCVQHRDIDRARRLAGLSKPSTETEPRP